MSPAIQFLCDTESDADLARRINPPDQALFHNYKSKMIHGAFDNRVFIVYKPARSEEPEIITTLRCLKFTCDSTNGAQVHLMDDATQEVETVGYIPQRPFGLDVFMSVPATLWVNWDATPVAGEVRRSMAYALLVKTLHRSDRHFPGETCCETPNRFRDLYPETTYGRAT